MTQNIYDNPDFFEGYSQLARSVEGLEGAGEWPAMRALLPDLRGRRVLDLGCGYGWFARWARERGAVQVLGLDVSERMLLRARSFGDDPGISYAKANLERVDLPASSFDLAYSSLVFHYIVDLEGLLARVHQALAAGGDIVFSVEHPIFTAPTHPGWTTTPDGRKTWPVDGYLDEGPRSIDWLATGVIKQHRTIATHLNLLVRLGFRLVHIDEWGPTPEQIAAGLSSATDHQRPPFLLFAARR